MECGVVGGRPLSHGEHAVGGASCSVERRLDGQVPPNLHVRHGHTGVRLSTGTLRSAGADEAVGVVCAVFDLVVALAKASLAKNVLCVAVVTSVVSLMNV